MTAVAMQPYEHAGATPQFTYMRTRDSSSANTRRAITCDKHSFEITTCARSVLLKQCKQDCA